MRADLHIHSIFSDGHYTPDEICRRAKKAGVELISITDHDTLNGEEEKRAAAKKYGLNYVTGWEISAYEGDEKIHTLGYNCDEKSEAYLAFMKERVAASYERAEDSIQKMRRAGIKVSMAEVLAMRADEDSPVHTMHIARAVAKLTNVTEGEAYNAYLAPTKVASSLIGRPTPKQAIDCIIASGGFAVVAHPGRIRMSLQEQEKLFDRLIVEGLEGIEAVYSTHTKKQTEDYLAYAEKNGLLYTGGSDTHFEEEIHQIGSPYFEPNERLLEKLKIYRG